VGKASHVSVGLASRAATERTGGAAGLSREG